MSSATQQAFNRDSQAAWYANRHLETDTGVRQIYYLPKGSPPQEIRFVEVNESISETTPLEPIDFGVDIGGPCAHTLYVLDVTPSQWDAIESCKLPLPAGWTLDGARTFSK